MSDLIGQWVPIEVGQYSISETEFKFYISINDITVHEADNRSRVVIEGAKLWAAAPY